MANNYQQLYDNSINDPNAQIELFKQIGIDLGIPSNVWNPFVDANSPGINIAVEIEGFNVNNPYFIFLAIYYNKTKNLDAFTNNEYNFGLLLNAVKFGELDIKQISFKCEEERQIRILVNESLWELPPNEITYLIKLYNWGTQVPGRYIKNIFIRFAFNTLTTSSNRLNFIKGMIFSDKLFKEIVKHRIDERSTKVKQKEMQEWAAKVADSFAISHPLLKTSLILENVKLIEDLAQESGRDVDGRYQKKDTEKESNEKKTAVQNKFSRLQDDDKDILTTMTAPLIKKYIEELKIKSASDLKELLEFLPSLIKDLYKKARELPKG